MIHVSAVEFDQSRPTRSKLGLIEWMKGYRWLFEKPQAFYLTLNVFRIYQIYNLLFSSRLVTGKTCL